MIKVYDREKDVLDKLEEDNREKSLKDLEERVTSIVNDILENNTSLDKNEQGEFLEKVSENISKDNFDVESDYVWYGSILGCVNEFRGCTLIESFDSVGDIEDIFVSCINNFEDYKECFEC